MGVGTVILDIVFTLNIYDRLCGLVVKSFRLQIQRPGFDSRLSDFLRSSGSGTGYTQPRKYK
jgi:hypothetical protein